MKTNAKLNYFVGKVCTIFTRPINRDFYVEAQESGTSALKQVMLYSIGYVESIDEMGVWLKQLHSSRKSFFYHDQIVNIAEEEVLDPKEDAAIIEQFQTAVVPPKKPASPYVDPSMMNDLVRQMKERQPVLTSQKPAGT